MDTVVRAEAGQRPEAGGRAAPGPTAVMVGSEARLSVELEAIPGSS